MKRYLAYDSGDQYDRNMYHIITVEPNQRELNTKVTITTHLTVPLKVYIYEKTVCGDVTPKELEMIYRDYLEKLKVMLKEKGNKEWKEHYLREDKNNEE